MGPTAHRAKRLGRNNGRYQGETIEIGRVVENCGQIGAANGWSQEWISAGPGVQILALSRVAPLAPLGSVPRRRRVYLSAGIHGDEPAGPRALEELLERDCWPRDLDLWVIPCLNPGGFVKGTRENPDGLDLNRQYRNPLAAETKAHLDWLGRQPHFDLCLALHEDWESSGFYLYELNPDGQPSLAETMLQAAAACCPIDSAEKIEALPAHGGIIRPVVNPEKRLDWPEALFLVGSQKTRLSYTLEGPSDFPLATRVAALTAAALAGLEVFCKRPFEADQDGPG